MLGLKANAAHSTASTAGLAHAVAITARPAGRARRTSSPRNRIFDGTARLRVPGLWSSSRAEAKTARLVGDGPDNRWLSGTQMAT